MRIFISYSSKDREYAGAVCDLLQNIGQDVFYAEETFRPGAQFESLLSEVRQCDMLLVVWSRNASASSWVNQEVGAALGTLKYVAAIALDETALPGFLGHRTALLAYKDPLRALPRLQQLVLKCQQELAAFRAQQHQANQQVTNWDGLKSLLAIAGVVGIATVVFGKK